MMQQYTFYYLMNNTKEKLVEVFCDVLGIHMTKLRVWRYLKDNGTYGINSIPLL
jgi:hypothetical protein